MALTVEDGTGIEGADAYVDTIDVDTYAAAYGKTGWDVLSSTLKETHIRRSTQFIDNKYPFVGTPLKAEQGLLFPMQSLVVRGWPVTGLPRQLLDAVCELAIISVTTDLVDSVAARAYTYRKVEVGDVKKTERYEEGTDDQKIFYSVELLLTPLLSSMLGNDVRTHKLMRA